METAERTRRTDALSSVLTIAGVKLSRRPPDAKHPFEYGRIEYCSAVAIAAKLALGRHGSIQGRTGTFLLNQ